MKCKDCKHLKQKKESYFGVDVGTEYMTCVLHPGHVAVSGDHFCHQFEKHGNKTLDEKE